MSYNYPFPIDAKLTAVSLAYKNDAYIADQILPRVQAPAESFKYRVFPKELYLTIPETKIGRKGVPNEVELSFTTETASVEGYGLSEVIPVADIKATALDGFDLQSKTTAYLTELMTLGRERRMADLIFNASSYANSNVNALATNSNFSAANSDPLKVIDDGLKVPFFRPNVIVMGEQVFDVLKFHPKIIRTVYPSADAGGVVSAQQLANILGVDKLLIGKARINSANRGKSANIVSAWGKHIALLYIAPGAGLNDMPSFGMTAEYGTRQTMLIAEQNTGVEGAYRIRVTERLKELVMAPDLGYLIKDAVN